mgnify:CR=1 FL=1
MADNEFRERAALAALRMFKADGEVIARLQHGESPQHELVAKFCYGLADAMVRERNRRMNAQVK